MACECTNDNKISDTVNLNKKFITLGEIKNLSIDEIVKLYREGYRLDTIPEIKSMIVAAPSVQDMTGFYNPSTSGGEVYTLFNNAGSCGWIRLEVGDTSNNIVFDTKNLCAPPRAVPLLYKSVSYYTGPIMETFGRMYACGATSDDSCAQTSCLTETPTCSRNITSMGSGLITPLPRYTSTVPNPPTNLQVTPGDGQLTFSWTSSNYSDPEYNMGVFDYYISLRGPDGITPPERAGHVMRNVTSYTFSNLTNGSTYTFEIRAITRCDVASSIASKTGVPTGPVTGTIHFAITTSDNGPKDGFAIYLDGSQTPVGTTNTAGEFNATVSASPSGTSHSYRISKQWYNDRTGSVTVYAGQTANVSQIMNRQTGAIHFVVTSGGTPVQGATVNVNGTDRGTTTSDGTLDVSNVYMGYSYQYTVSKTYFNTASGTVILDSTPKTQSISLARQTGTIHFAVTSGGTPLSNVAIGVDTIARGTTLGDGTLDVSNLDMGISHPYTATLTNYNPASGSVLLDTSPKTEMVAMTLSSATGTIHFVVTSAGNPLANVSISVDNGTPGLTDSNGILDISGLAMNVSHAYTATKTGYNPASGSVLLDTTPKTVSISMVPTTAGTGSVRFHINCAGAPCQGAQIWITGTNRGQTGIDGILLLTNLPVGGINYTVKKSGYQNALGTVIVAEGTITDAGAISLTEQVAQAGFGGAGMILIAGLSIGAMYMMSRKPPTKSEGIK